MLKRLSNEPKTPNYLLSNSATCSRIARYCGYKKVYIKVYIYAFINTIHYIQHKNNYVYKYAEKGKEIDNGRVPVSALQSMHKVPVFRKDPNQPGTVFIVSSRDSSNSNRNSKKYLNFAFGDFPNDCGVAQHHPSLRRTEKIRIQQLYICVYVVVYLCRSCKYLITQQFVSSDI